MIIEPIMTFIPSKIEIHSVPFVNVVTTVSGINEPKTMDFCYPVNGTNTTSKMD